MHYPIILLVSVQGIHVSIQIARPHLYSCLLNQVITLLKWNLQLCHQHQHLFLHFTDVIDPVNAGARKDNEKGGGGSSESGERRVSVDAVATTLMLIGRVKFIYHRINKMHAVNIYFSGFLAETLSTIHGFYSDPYTKLVSFNAAGIDDHR
ncbi:hypothetical protein Tco_0799988 [Tanacetum coccineum]|uniref:Uncharacterized protein n=1 Tax=Tanacetum coccineum TaxID=301880 RepID=A0ABQ4ZSW2_9ASTR